MKSIATSLVVALVVSTAACRGPGFVEDHQGTRKMWVGEAIHGASIDKAIVTQRTLYPYHFHVGSAQLNELGERDLGVLAEHFRAYGGASLNLRRGGASSDLQRARIETIAAYLREAGLEETLEVGGGLPGGDGIASERVVAILADQTELDTTDVSTTSEEE